MIRKAKNGPAIHIDFRFVFVMFPRLYQNLRLRTKFRQIWTIRGSDTDITIFKMLTSAVLDFRN